MNGLYGMVSQQKSGGAKKTDGEKITAAGKD